MNVFKICCSTKSSFPSVDFLNVFLFVGEVGCSYCDGLGHRIADCPKLEAMQIKQAQGIGRKDYLAHSSADW